MPDYGTTEGGALLGMIGLRSGRTANVISQEATARRASTLPSFTNWYPTAGGGTEQYAVDVPRGVAAEGVRDVGYAGQLPDLESLLKHHEVVSAILLSDEDVVSRRHRQMWFALVVVALVWGTLTGLAIGARGFFLAVPPALLGCAAIVVLSATLWVMAREQR